MWCSNDNKEESVIRWLHFEAFGKKEANKLRACKKVS